MRDRRKVKIIIFLLSILLLIGLTFIGKQIYDSTKNTSLYKEIKVDDKNPLEDLNVKKVNSLRAINKDIKGWIKIDDTNIDYPLLQSIDNEYYLNHNYKKEKTKYGSIFINSNSNIKDNKSNIIIYGHNMADGQMFKDLTKYANESYYKKHPNITIVLEDKVYTYKIAYVFKSRVFYQNEENVFRYYKYYNFDSEDKFLEYKNNSEKLRLYDTGVEINYNEQIITLITCEYSQKNGRMVIVAKRVE